MIDWLNFWIWGVFVFAGMVFLFKAFVEDKAKRILVYTFLSGFFLFFPLFTIEIDVSFDSAVHECTEWEQVAYCYNETYQSVTSSLHIVTGGVSVGCSGNLKMRFVGYGECVSFRAKTECELGNPEYLQYGISCYKKTPCELGDFDYVYSWDVSNSDGSGFGAKQPLECIRAVPKVTG